MSSSPDWSDLRLLPWLPEITDWSARVKVAQVSDTPWQDYVALANSKMDFVLSDRLDRAIKATFNGSYPKELASKPIKLAILGSSTVAHLLPGIRIAGVRRGMWFDTYECGYGQYLQELSDSTSPLHAFRPSVVLLNIDSRTIARGADIGISKADAVAVVENETNQLRECWHQAHASFRCQVIQQTALPVFSNVMGHNEQRTPGSRASLIAEFNRRLREEADEAGVDLLALDDRVRADGLSAWYDPSLWHRAKQEISPRAGPLYGDHVARLIAARQGKSFKCLVLDLDNTLWGGVIGDDGLEGIVIGQGSAVGEAFLSFQEYAKDLARRGVILAVCSKNDEKNAMEVFDKHPDMLLRGSDIACFVANWDDKAKNIRSIAQRLNIGLDSLVFLDDSPFERNLVRSELPFVAVPEVPDDPAMFGFALSEAGYFEGLSITNEDRGRAELYRDNAARETLAAISADLPTFLKSLDMTLVWKRFDRVGQQRIVQLINKTNQFNLTTKRYTDEEFLVLLKDNNAFGLQLRLLDRFGDNGIIGIVIGRLENRDDLMLDTWLMSCRVLGRQVEEATLGLVISQAKEIGAKRIIGEYRPTIKNKMVENHYSRLGFKPLATVANGTKRESLIISEFDVPPTFITIKEG